MTYQIDFILTLGILRSTEPLARERALKMEKRKTVPQDEPEVPNKKDMKLFKILFLGLLLLFCHNRSGANFWAILICS